MSWGDFSECIALHLETGQVELPVSSNAKEIKQFSGERKARFLGRELRPSRYVPQWFL